MAWYKRGTITLTQGSAAVTGTDAMFTAGIMEGSGIVVAGQYLAGVLSVEDNDHLTLSKPWPHATMTAVAYEAYPTESRAARQLDLTAELIDSFSPLRGSAQDFKDKITDRADEVAANQADVAAKLIQTIAARDAALTAEINAETAQVASEAARDVAITKRNEAVAARDASITAKTASETARDASITAKTASETAKTASETARDASIAAKTASETAKTASETARNASQTAQAASELARDGSVTAKTASEAARDVASTKRDEAVAAKTASEAARDIAITKRDEAGTFRNQAEAEKLAAQTARTGAETAEDNAALSAADAAQSATDAQTAQTGAEAARDVSVSAKTASEGARDASVAAKVASEGARDTAITNRNEAISAKTAAETARDVAISNRNDAVSAAVDAAGSAGDAAGSASSAADSAAAAAASALEASQFDATLYPKLAQDNVFSGSMTVPYLTVASGSGSTTEGGEIKLKKASGQGLDGDLIVDTQGNNFRVFDQTTPSRMLSYDLVAGHLSINGQSVYHTGNKPSKADVGLGSVENKSSATIRGELTSANVTNALSFTPVRQGGGVDQTTNTVKIGWSSIGRLKATVDSTDLGNFIFESHLTKAAVGLGSVDNTSDAAKPVSTAQQTALDAKANASVTLTAGNGLTGGGAISGNVTFTLGTPGTLTGNTTNSVTATSHTHDISLTKADVGLGSVDNTSDANKPVSTATQTALNGKVDLAGDVMTGLLTMSRNSGEQIRLGYNTASALDAYISFFQTGTTRSAYIQSHRTNGLILYNDLGTCNLTLTNAGLLTFNGVDVLDLANSKGTLPNARFSGTYNGITEIEASRLRAISTGDVSLTSTGHGFQCGPDTGLNIAMDQNEIMARNNGTAATLALNVDGGAVTINGNTAYHTGNTPAWQTADGRAYPRRVGGVDLNFNWSGQGGQPTWVWGGSDGSNMYVYNPSNFSVNYANSANALSNSPGGAPHYACRSWVRFNGQGVVSMYGAGNVSSISDLGTGLYHVNFAVAMPDTLGCIQLSSGYFNTVNQTIIADWVNSSQILVRTYSGNTASAYDLANVYVAIFR